MMRLLFLFVDGIGLGDDDPDVNPFAVAQTPTLHALSGGRGWFRQTGRQSTERATFIPTDPRLGVAGRPQSGSSQAVILTGENVPARIGRHYGPKPSPDIRAILDEDNFFKRVQRAGKRAQLLDAYPPRWHEGINSGKSLPSSLQYAALSAGQRIYGLDDLVAGRALTPEWTGAGWREHLGLEGIPILTPPEAGRRMVKLSEGYAFTLHSHWMTDYVGHRGPFAEAVTLLERLDGVLAGILEAWDDDAGLVILTSDHGNMEVIGERHHTENDVPTVLIGAPDLRERFAEGFSRLTDFVPRMAHLIF